MSKKTWMKNDQTKITDANAIAMDLLDEKMRIFNKRHVVQRNSIKGIVSSLEVLLARGIISLSNMSRDDWL